MIKKFIKNYIGNAGTKNDIDREQWIKTALSVLSEGGRILDVGAGEQRYRSYCSHLSYVSQDFCEYDGKGNKEGLQPGTWDTSRIDIISDITAIPEPDASFDAILCTEVFEHIPDPISALNEFHRLLRPGGELILSAPFCSLTHFAPYHYYSGFNRYFYEYYLPKIGFTITEITANGDWSKYLAQELRRLLTIYGKSPLYVRFCIGIILRFIFINRSFNNTSDLGCFGFHIRAVKN
ncbi:methyltransferase domain-containing protein [Candidatus Bathyarchaeota archaeon]|nr:methyltransferase domain-containing protein [Candidatus Bathyarchaeota archaeon]